MVSTKCSYALPKIGHYVSVTRTGHRVGAASKREGWGGGYTSPSGCLPYLPHSLLNLHKLSLTLVSASVSMRVFAGIAESSAQPLGIHSIPAPSRRASPLSLASVLILPCSTPEAQSTARGTSISGAPMMPPNPYALRPGPARLPSQEP